MSDEKKKEEEKDFTGIIELAKNYTPPPSDKKEEFAEDKPIEQIERWESLDEYAQTNPAAEPPPEESVIETPAAEEVSVATPAETQFEETPIEAAADPAMETAPTATDDFPTTTADNSRDFQTTEAENVSPETPATEEDLFAITEPTPENSAATSGMDFETTPVEEPIVPDAIEASPASPPPVEATPVTTAAAPPKPAQAALKAIQSTANKAMTQKTAVKPAQPFSLIIRGKLTDYEQAKLLDILHRENFGIRDTDLEPQFESGQVLIPQISEYAGILLVQALRGTSADMRFAPADQISRSKEEPETTPDPENDEQSSTSRASQERHWTLHPAEDIPLLPGDEIDSIPNPEILGTLVTTAGLTATIVEAQNSSEYLDTLEALKKQLQYKAHYKGAHAVIQLKVQLENLLLPSMYRLTVMGVAIRPRVSETAADANP